MVDLDRAKAPDSKWFWILVLLALFVMAIFWFANPLGTKPPAAKPATAQMHNVAPAGSAPLPLTLPTTNQ